MRNGLDVITTLHRHWLRGLAIHLADELVPPLIERRVIFDNAIVRTLTDRQFVDLLVEARVTDQGELSVVEVVATSEAEEATGVSSNASESGLEVGGTGDTSEGSDSEVVD